MPYICDLYDICEKCDIFVRYMWHMCHVQDDHSAPQWVFLWPLSICQCHLSPAGGHWGHFLLQVRLYTTAHTTAKYYCKYCCKILPQNTSAKYCTLLNSTVHLCLFTTVHYFTLYTLHFTSLLNTTVLYCILLFNTVLLCCDILYCVMYCSPTMFVTVSHSPCNEQFLWYLPL